MEPSEPQSVPAPTPVIVPVQQQSDWKEWFPKALEDLKKATSKEGTGKVDEKAIAEDREAVKEPGKLRSAAATSSWRWVLPTVLFGAALVAGLVLRRLRRNHD
ncbi:MAG: hypothetical protein WD768_23325 [Phycisphaeraceae bacterium]